MKMRITQWVFLGLLILMIFHPIFYFKKEVPPYGILIIDQSESMDHAKRIEIKSSFIIKNFYFGTTENGTDIGKAIREAIEIYPEASFMILYSDGSNTKGESPIRVASKIGIPIFFIVPELREKTNKGFISVYGPNSVEEGDSAKISVYYKVTNTATLEINYERKVRKKNIRKEGIYDFSFLPSAGKKNIQLNLLIENDTADKINWALDVKKKRKIFIISRIPNWNHKFIKRYFENKGWNVEENKKDNVNFQTNQNVDIICFLSNPVKYKENIQDYLKKGGKIIVVSSASEDPDFLPVIAPTLSKYSGKLPESYYLKAGGIKRNSKTLEIGGEKIGYLIAFRGGTVVQFTYLELWKLALSARKFYPENFFEELMEKTLGILIPEDIIISYSKKLLEGEDFILKFDKQTKSIKTFLWDGQKIPTVGDSIIVKNPTTGLHNFKINLSSHSIEDSVLIVSGPKDKMGIDTLVLSGIANISGGGRWNKDFSKENLKSKEKEIWINLRHNWFFISFLFLLLFFDWVLWMRVKLPQRHKDTKKMGRR
jgi:hypothetical protein